MNDDKQRIWLLLFVLIVGGGAALRFSGIDFGSPAASARPDEDLLIREALYLCAGDEVRYHRYPPGLMYIQSASFEVAATLGYLGHDHLYDYAVDPMPYHRVARRVSWLFSLLTLIVVGLTARHLGGWRAAALAALTLSVCPLHALHSRFATVDVPGTFFVALAIHLSLVGRGARLAPYAAAAFFAGLAAAMKYPLGMVGIVPLALALRRGLGWKGASVIFGAALIGLLAGAPTWLTDPGAVLDGIRVESESQSGRRALISMSDIVSHHLWLSLMDGFGIGVLALTLASLALAAVRHTRLAALCLFVACLTAFNLFAGVPFMRYFVPLAPITALACATLPSFGRGRTPLLLSLIVVGLQVPTLVQSVKMTQMLGKKDTRGEFLEALQDGTLPADLPVVVPDFPFQVLPAARSADLEDRAALENALNKAGHLVDERGEFQREVIRRLAGADGSKTTVIFDEGQKDSAVLRSLLARGDFLVVLPETPAFGANWITFPFQRDVLEPRLRAAAEAKEIRMDLLLDLDPRRDGRFPPASWYGGFDYWFIPLGAPDLVKRPGPRLRVFRISSPR